MTSVVILWPVVKLLIWVILSTTVYAIILRRLAKAAQPARLRLAEEGEELLADDALPDGAKTQIRFYLDNAFSGTAAVKWSLAMPIAMIRLALGGPPETYPKEVEARLTRLGDWFGLSIFAANPIFGTIVILEIVTLGTMLVVVTGSFAVISGAIDAVARLGVRRAVGLRFRTLTR